MDIDFKNGTLESAIIIGVGVSCRKIRLETGNHRIYLCPNGHDYLSSYEYGTIVHLTMAMVTMHLIVLEITVKKQWLEEEYYDARVMFDNFGINVENVIDIMQNYCYTRVNNNTREMLYEPTQVIAILRLLVKLLVLNCNYTNSTKIDKFADGECNVELHENTFEA